MLASLKRLVPEARCDLLFAAEFIQAGSVHFPVLLQHHIRKAHTCCGAAQPSARTLMNMLHGFGSYPDLGDDEHYTLAKVYRDAARICGNNADIDGFLQCMSAGSDKGACLACFLRLFACWHRHLLHSRMGASDSFCRVLLCSLATISWVARDLHAMEPRLCCPGAGHTCWGAPSRPGVTTTAQDDEDEDEDSDGEYHPISGDAGLLRCNGARFCQP